MTAVDDRQRLGRRARLLAGVNVAYNGVEANHEVMIRGTFANIRLRNQLAPGTEGGFTIKFARGDGGDAAEQTTIYEASQAYQAEGTPLVILAGKEYGSGSSRGPTSNCRRRTC